MEIIENKSDEVQKKRQKDKEFADNNSKQYSDPSIKKKEQFVEKIKVEKGYKEKVIERVTYKNGVEKNRLVGILLNGVLKFGVKPDKKHGVL